MKIRYMLMFGAAVLFGATGCGHKETDELSHHHDHAHSHEDHDHEGHDHGDHDHEGHSHEGHSHEGHDHESAQKDSHEGDDVITLSPEVAARFGVAVDTAAVRDFGGAVKVSGQILPSSEGAAVISAPASGILTLNPGINPGAAVKAGAAIGSVKADAVTGGDANRAAKASLDAAKAEWDRVERLYADRLVTLAQYNAAKAAYESARASYSAPAASGRAVSPISGVITSLDARTGQFVEAGSPVATVAASGRLTLRADVPAREYAAVASASDARVVLPYSGGTVLLSALGGKRTGGADAMAAASGGYVPVTFSLRNDGSLIPGTAVEVYLLGADASRALTVPVSAVSEQQGTYFVFVRLDEDCYRKLPVTVGQSDGHDIEIISGLKGGEHIVSQGVTAVKLAQASGNVPEGHSHSH